jgi:electron transport complex protein RnfB
MVLGNITELWQGAWPAGVTMLSLGAGFAIVLLIASIKLHVVVDAKIEQVHEALPGIDCGACGFAGCSSYAKAVAGNPELLGKCAPGGTDTAEKIAGILNLQVSGGTISLRPIVHCRAHTEDRTYYADYSGIPTCTAANAQPPVQACKFGCMGYGDCRRACKFDALSIIDGLAVVDYEKCTGCTACSRACPRDLITMVPFSQGNMMTVACSSRENGKSTRSMCKVGCIGCNMCAKQSELFTIDNNLAKIDVEKYQPSEETQTAMDKCPTGVIVYRGKNAPEPRPAGQKTAAKG